MIASVASKLRKEWFLLGIVLSILLAKLQPTIGKTGGLLKPEITIKYFAVSIIFFNSGISLRSEELLKSFTNYRLHALIQGFTFIVVPIFVNILVAMLKHLAIDEWLLKGLIVVSCMPPPVSSAVILTKASGGNEAGAIFNSAFGSFLGVIVTPLLLLATLGSAATVPFLSVFTKLGLTVVLPLVLGQIVRMYVKNWLETTKPPIGTIGSCILLIIIYTTFCDTFSGNYDIFIPLSIVIPQFTNINNTNMQTITVVAGDAASSIPMGNVVAAVFCGTHKSLTLGSMPVLKIVFGGYSQLSLLSIPLLIYHPLQILFGGLLVPTVQKWLSQHQDAENLESV
ncbi:uncharacterized protein TRIADDRAFT_25902 [Trichoplax adhaerens]|uniref:Sodium/bile acid cotransporter n=1 Tax=Trichoplax adhaerens TaxID=10228 RepID=B3RXM9_TRIAD|nr:hypothetical protein TRIADDRAFT_25902 [Trichoplax adhaerens]EDV24457.1 hypothetical protein TRIADDRAFT_25902 [Trichoplax adhaerens]|eukprot:XP_002112347.1 hypothetical protein TRIADDRAFT_25902 [Trichoplax adhaerens]